MAMVIEFYVSRSLSQAGEMGSSAGAGPGSRVSRDPEEIGLKKVTPEKIAQR
jgi:hypothetical protein